MPESASKSNQGLGVSPGAGVPAKQGARSNMTSLTEKIPQIGGGNLLLIGLFVAGIGAVYLLSIRGGPVEASASEQRNEIRVTGALAKLRQAAKPSKAKAVVESFYFEARDRQIPQDKLSGNPFVSIAQLMQKPEEEKPETDQPEAPKGDEAMLVAVDQLKLDSILTGPSGKIAMISGSLLTEGQKISGWTVRQIRDKRVVLVWKDHQRVMQLEQ